MPSAKPSAGTWASARRFERARGFYGVIIAATVIGGSINFIGVDPIKALFWSAVINGVAAVPIMAMIMAYGGPP